MTARPPCVVVRASRAGAGAAPTFIDPLGDCRPCHR